MLAKTYRQVARLIGYTGSWKFGFLSGVMGQSLNVLLATYLGADLSGRVFKAIELNDEKILYDSIPKILPLLLCIIFINAISSYMTECGCLKAIAGIRRHVLSRMLESSLDKTGILHSGIKLSCLLNDAPIAAEGLGKILQVPLTGIFMGLGGMIYVIGVDIRIALIALALGIFTLTYSIFFSRRLRRSGVQAQSALAVAGERLKSLLDGAVTARIYNMRKMLEERYSKAAYDAKNARVRFAFDSALLGGLNNAQYHIGEKLLVFAAGVLLLDGVLDLPALITVSQMAGGVVGVFHISRILPDIQKALAGAGRIFDLLDDAGNTSEGTEDITPSESGKAITVSDVSFCYSERDRLVENLTFSVEAGEMIALAGDSGSGKSTLLRLIQGLLEPQSGKIEVFGTDTRKARPASLRKNISFVPQDVVLFPGTISENILIGCENISRQQILQAAIDANAHDFIIEMENGYETYVSERGLSLSGGQRQRIAMARAFLRNAPIVLLDEASASLDAQNEELFKQSLLRKKGRQTFVIVTHNHSVASIADRIIYV